MATTARATRRIPGAPPTTTCRPLHCSARRAQQNVLSTPCPSAPPPDLDGAKTHSQTGVSWGTALWSTCRSHPGQRTTHSTMKHFARAYTHAPTRTSNSPLRCQHTSWPLCISTACLVGWECGRGCGGAWPRVCTLAREGAAVDLGATCSLSHSIQTYKRATHQARHARHWNANTCQHTAHHAWTWVYRMDLQPSLGL